MSEETEIVVDTEVVKEETVEEPVDDLYFIKDEEVKSLLKKSDNIEFKKTLIDTVKHIKERKMNSIMAIRKEIDSLYKDGGLSINLDDYVPEGNYIWMYHQLINDLDAGRSRLMEISSQTSSDFACITDYYEKLNNIWKGCYSKQSSADKRSGESDRVTFFLMHSLIARRDIHTAVKSRLSDVTSKMEALSRKITVAQEMLKNFPGMVNECGEALKLKNN